MGLGGTADYVDLLAIERLHKALHLLAVMMESGTPRLVSFHDHHTDQLE